MSVPESKTKTKTYVISNLASTFFILCVIGVLCCIQTHAVLFLLFTTLQGPVLHIKFVYNVVRALRQLMVTFFSEKHLFAAQIMQT